LYVIMGTDKCVLIDTGCGGSNGGYYRDFVDKMNDKKLPYLVICTHVHFDHVGGNHRFCGTYSKGSQGICMGVGNKTFTENYELNSLAMAHNTTTPKFTISHWLKDGDLIYLNDEKKEKNNSLEILLTPGHTPDSLAVYSHRDKRLFVGDNIYPFTAIHLDCLGSSVKDYIISLNKLNSFVSQVKKNLQEEAKKEKDKDKEKEKEDKEKEKEKEKEKPTSESSTTPTTTTTTTTTTTPTTTTKPTTSNKPTPRKGPHPHQKLIEQFLSMIGLNATNAKKEFSMDSLLALSNYTLDEMVSFYLDNREMIGRLCPPEEEEQPMNTTQDSFSSGKDDFKKSEQKDIVLSCGHVESDLEVGAIDELLGLIEAIRAGAVSSSHLDGGYAEYTNGRFNLLMPAKNVKWE